MATATQTRKSRKPARVTHGTCRLLCWPLPLAESLETAGGAILELLPQRGKETNYYVRTIRDDSGRLLGYRLEKIGGKGEVYDVDVTPDYGWQCDCPDAQFQGRECKHVHALRAALSAKGIVVAKPATPKPSPSTSAPVILPLPAPMRPAAVALEPTAFDDP